MEANEARDTYVTQLKEVFDSCDTTGSGCLNEVELNSLCQKLHLTEHTSFLVHHLLEKKGNSVVNFEEFKECFVAVLTQSVPSEDENEEEKDKNISDEREETGVREVSPKFTLGRKKYGRRSRPASTAEDDSPLSSGSASPNSSFSLSQQGVTEQFSSSLIMPFKSPQKGDSMPGKRPVSPCHTQQPPMKSGRMVTNETVNTCVQPGSQEDGYSHQRSSSESEMNLSFENNPVQYLQQTWKKLGIGKDGYLNVDELALVCEHIGMVMTDEVIAQLFEKLDCDQDGQISFEEFLQGLFQHGEPQSCESLALKNEAPTKSIYKDASREDHQLSTSFISGIFSCIDSNNTGYAEASTILELWESLEMSCSPQLLEDLGVSLGQKTNLGDLSSILEDELISSVTTPLGQLAFVSYQNELNYLRQSNEQIRSERNKLRVSIEEANARAALLAQEVDDNHAKLENALKEKLLLIEKKYQEQARELVEELQQERDVVSVQTNSLRQQLQTEIQAVREEEAQLKNRLNVLEQDNARLELELQEATEKYLETEKLNEVLQKELSVMPNLKARLADLESHHGEIQERHHQSLLLDIDNHKKINQELLDKIDELTLEIENLQQQNIVTENSNNKSVNRTHSWLSDYKKAASVGFKRRGSESSSDENSDDESPTTGKVRKTFLTPDGKLSVETETQDEKYNLEDIEHCKNSKPSKGNQPTSIDKLLKDMFVDRALLMKRLHASEESKQKIERANGQLRNKCKMLSKLVIDVSKTALATFHTGGIVFLEIRVMMAGQTGDPGSCGYSISGTYVCQTDFTITKCSAIIYGKWSSRGDDHFSYDVAAITATLQRSSHSDIHRGDYTHYREAIFTALKGNN